MPLAQIVELPIGNLRPYARNARTHSKKQIRQIAASIERFGFTNPVLVSDEGEIIAGHGRVEAARQLGWQKVPTLALSHLSEAERRAYVLADNKLATNAGWDRDILAIELQALVDLEFDVELTGFSLAEIDLVLDQAGDADPAAADGEDDRLPATSEQAVSRMGDLWALGRHRLLCGDTRSPADMDRLMAGERADLVFTDPPYNVAIDGHVCGLGTVKHREFAFASGEMSKTQFTSFLADTLGNIARVMRDGAIAYVCMDWRHMFDIINDMMAPRYKAKLENRSYAEGASREPVRMLADARPQGQRGRRSGGDRHHVASGTAGRVGAALRRRSPPSLG